MRIHPVLILVLGVSLSACSDPAGELAGGPAGPSIGTLVVSTATVGDDPDPDGYVLTVDDADSLDLGSTDTLEVDLPPGRHTLRLFGVAGQCAVTPATPFEVEVPAGSRTPIAFGVSCPATGVRITTTTTGADIDPDGYQVAVDDTDRGPIAANGTMLIRLDPGSRTVGLAGFASNCAIEGSAAHTVTIVTAEVATIDFVVVCTALQPQMGFIWGQVLGEGVGCIRGAMVEIVEGPGTGRKSSQPDPPLCDPWGELGFEFDNLPLGATVTLRATASGYQPEDSVVVVPGGGGPLQFVLQPADDLRTIRLEILSHLYDDITPSGRVPVQFIVDGQVHDIQVPSGPSTFYFGDLAGGSHTLRAQFSYNGWVQCQFHPGWHTQPVITLEADTTRVEFEIVSTAHCHFL